MHAFYSILLEGSPFNNKFVFDMLFICLFTCRLFLDTLLIKFVVYHESYFCIYSFKKKFASEDKLHHNFSPFMKSLRLFSSSVEKLAIYLQN